MVCPEHFIDQTNFLSGQNQLFPFGIKSANACAYLPPVLLLQQHSVQIVRCLAQMLPAQWLEQMNGGKAALLP
jgi:hypothetical protein